ncbi:pilS cassette [Neisseria meningitidis]|uniref:pilS cassette n=1 Tax=Neisseria meningitidis TaxID=487 RepID=UPI00031F8FBB|nr:pilS cassette [Neisseria meningitidis]MBJ7782275.1 pilS cassette [Neisseria meningitidis]MBJ7821282.1 pilS cassette [Neisseria meningitidis]
MNKTERRKFNLPCRQNLARYKIPSFPLRRESTVKLEKPSFEKQFLNFKNGFPPVRE